jgi:hypothetical protein
MKMYQLRPLCIAATIFASACSGGGGNSITPASISTSTPIASAGTAAKLSIVVPQKSTTSSQSAKRPQYVSPSSAQLYVAVNGGTPSTYGLSPSTPGCSVIAGQLTCAFTVPAPAGSDSFLLSLADSAGNVLSHNVVTATLTPGATTPVNVTLAGVPVSVAVVPGTGATIDGNISTGFHIPGLFAQPIELEALDADGNVIIGPGAPTIGTPTVNGNPNVSIVSANSTDPNAYVLKAVAGAGGATVSVAASAQGIPLNDGTTSSPISSSQNFTYTPAIVTASGTKIAAYSVESGNQIALWNACPGLCSTTLATGVQTDSAGNVYALVEYIAGTSQQRDVQIYPAGSTVIKTQMASANGVTGAVSVAFGPNILYVLQVGTGFGLSHHPPAITEYVGSATTPTYKITGGLTSPQSIAVDSAGKVYVSDGAHISVYPAGAAATWSSQMSDPSLAAASYLAFDSSGGLYVEDSTNKNIHYFAHNSTGLSTSVTSTINDPSFQGNPQALSLDSSGNMWLSINNSSIEQLSGALLPTAVKVLRTIYAPGAAAWIP